MRWAQGAPMRWEIVSALPQVSTGLAGVDCSKVAIADAF